MRSEIGPAIIWPAAEAIRKLVSTSWAASKSTPISSRKSGIAGAIMASASTDAEAQSPSNVRGGYQTGAALSLAASEIDENDYGIWLANSIEAP